MLVGNYSNEASTGRTCFFGKEVFLKLLNLSFCILCLAGYINAKASIYYKEEYSIATSFYRNKYIKKDPLETIYNILVILGGVSCPSFSCTI